MKFLKGKFPDLYFTHNKSVGKDCTEGHLFPDIRYDCCLVSEENSYVPYFVIVEVDEHSHRRSSYECDKRRMVDIVAKLAAPCVFIRYNPDSADSDLEVLARYVKKYTSLKSFPKEWEDMKLGCIKTKYLFY